MHYVLAISVITLYIYLRFGKKALAVVLLAIALLALLRGMIVISLPLLLIAYYLNKNNQGWLSGKGSLGKRWSRKGEQDPNTAQSIKEGKPVITSRFIGLNLQEEDGRVAGWVRKGPHKGSALEHIAQADLKALKAHYEAKDRESAAFLYVYLDQTYPAWREVENKPLSGDASASASPLTEGEALAALGLAPNPTSDQVKQAHRRLMKKFHPDQGGSAIIAAKLNMAKDKLTS